MWKNLREEQDMGKSDRKIGPNGNHALNDSYGIDIRKYWRPELMRFANC
jgi:hypothetical protein